MADLWRVIANLRVFCVFGLCCRFERVGLLCMGSCAARAPGRDEGRCLSAGHLTQTSGSPWAPGFSFFSYTVLSIPSALG